VFGQAIEELSCADRHFSPFGLPSVITPFLASTHGMVSPSTVVLYLTFFTRRWGPLVQLYFSKRLPEPLLFVEPHFPLGTLAIPVCPVTHSFGALFLSHLRAFSPPQNVLETRLCLPVNLLLLYSCSTSTFYPLLASAKQSHIRRQVGAEPFLRSLHLYITWVSQLILRPLHTNPLLCSFIASPTSPLCVYMFLPPVTKSQQPTIPHTHGFSLASVLYLFLRFFFSLCASISVCFSFMGLLKQAQVFFFVTFFVYIYYSG